MSRFERAEPAPLRRELGLPAGARLIGCVARLEEQKGVEYFITAARLMRGHSPEAVFVVAGDGPRGAQLRQSVAAQGLESSFRLLGHRDDVPAFMAALDVFVLPSLWEGLPNVVLEAMAAGCPTVATDIDGTRELMIDGQSGLLVPAGDPVAIANAVSRLVGAPGLAGKLVAAGQAVAREHAVERMVTRTEATYEQVLGQP